MLTTDKSSCNILVKILREKGVSNAVLCPGSRNLPIITAFLSEPEIECTNIIDEREAAFFALGIAEITEKPVAVVCTSGTAVLNFAPAVAEAYYKHLPVIVISADRPIEWIDQEDSQTIRQNHILNNIVKGSFNVGEKVDYDGQRYIGRVVTEAMFLALQGLPGPVHINVPLSKPLDIRVESSEADNVKDISLAPVTAEIDKDFILYLAERIQSVPKVMIAAGSYPPSHRLSRSLARLSQLENVVILAEALSNIHLPGNMIGFEILENLDEEAWRELRPDILVTFGGPFVSQNFKKRIRESAEMIDHWHVSEATGIIDTFQCLRLKIPVKPEIFFMRLRQALRKNNPSSPSVYSRRWFAKTQEINTLRSACLNKDEWCDLTVLHKVLRSLPSSCNIQISNGMSIRYFNSLPLSYRFHRADCNRGVSGIDGSTSTALGAARSYKGTTVLISGDMSARYDFGVLLDAPRLTKNFKMLVLSNGGGNIFRMIKGGDSNDILRDYVYGMDEMNWNGIEELARWKVFGAASIKELEKIIPQWLTTREAPSLLIAYTDADINVRCFKTIFT